MSVRELAEELVPPEDALQLERLQRELNALRERESLFERLGQPHNVHLTDLDRKVVEKQMKQIRDRHEQLRQRRAREQLREQRQLEEAMAMRNLQLRDQRVPREHHPPPTSLHPLHPGGGGHPGGSGKGSGMEAGQVTGEDEEEDEEEEEGEEEEEEEEDTRGYGLDTSISYLSPDYMQADSAQAYSAQAYSSSPLKPLTVNLARLEKEEAEYGGDGTSGKRRVRR
jgi:multidrug efflux pump subunit AcrA (membrane-fusion protein)